MASGSYSPDAMAVIEQERVRQQKSREPQSVGQYSPEALKVVEEISRDARQRGLLGRAADAISEAFTGNERTQFPDAREFVDYRPGSAGKALQGAATMSLVPDEMQQADILKQQYPGALFMRDKSGNLMIQPTADDEVFYLNKPGLSKQDAASFGGAIATFAPAAKAVSMVPNVFGKAVAAAVAGSGTSAIVDRIAEEFGSKQGIDLGRAAITGIGGAISEPVGWLIGRGMAALPWGKGGLIDSRGNLTRRGQEFLKAINVSADDVDKPSLFQLEKLARNLTKREIDNIAAQTESAARSAAGSAQPSTAQQLSQIAKSREFGIQLRPAQVAQDYGAEAEFQSFLRNSGGAKAGDIARSFQSRQDQQVDDAVGMLQERVSRRSVPLSATPEDQAQTLVSGVQDRAALQRQRVDRAYKEARQFDARVPVAQVTGMRKRIDAALREDNAVLDPVLSQQARRAADRFRRFDDLLNKKKEAGLPTITSVTLKRLETERRRLRAALGMKNLADEDFRNLRTIKRTFDRYIDEVFDQGLFSGDPIALAALKKARSERKIYGDLFEDRGKYDFSGKVIEEMADSDMPPIKAANYLFGASRLGEGQQSAAIVRRLKNIFGNDSQEFQELKQAAIARLIYGPGAPKRVTPEKMVAGINELLNGRGKQYASELFTESELGTIRSFRDAIKPLQKPDGTVNYSNTGYEISRQVQGLFRRMLSTTAGLKGGPGAAIVTDMGLEQLVGRKATREARKAIEAAEKQLIDRVYRTPLINAGSGFVFGSELTSDN